MNIKPYIEFVNESVFRIGKTLPRTRKQVEKVVDWYKVSLGDKQRINDDLTVDILGDVELDELDLDIIPLKFNRVDGDFYITNNKLKNLIGVPRIMNGDFDCWNNEITSLNGLPKIIQGTLSCKKNKLTDLSYCPNEIFGSLICSENNITKLNASHVKLHGEFYCDNNKIINLNGFPIMDDKSLIVIVPNDKLISLDGLPDNINLWNIISQRKQNKKIIELGFEYLFKNLTRDQSLIKYNIEWIKAHKDDMPDKFREEFEHLLEIHDYL